VADQTLQKASSSSDLISSAEWPRSGSSSHFEPSGYGARLSIDFERIMQKTAPACAMFSIAVDQLGLIHSGHAAALAVISSAQWLWRTLEN